MIVDTSVFVAILFGEPDAALYSDLLEAADTIAISAVTRVELAVVVEGRKGPGGRGPMEELVAGLGVETVPVSAEQAVLAIEAYRQFGKGMHPAALNIGDCFVYALSKASGRPLLFKGEDFRRTDVVAAFPQATRT
jgi:ribonuclease VapC